jgi:hypothetical protein
MCVKLKVMAPPPNLVADLLEPFPPKGEATERIEVEHTAVTVCVQLPHEQPNPQVMALVVEPAPDPRIVAGRGLYPIANETLLATLDGGQ